LGWREGGKGREEGKTNLLSQLTSKLSTSEFLISSNDDSSVGSNEHGVLLFEKSLDVRKPGIVGRESVGEVGFLRLFNERKEKEKKRHERVSVVKRVARRVESLLGEPWIR